MKKLILILSVVVVAIIAGISSSVFDLTDKNSNEMNLIDQGSHTSESEKIVITTTTNVITDLVENIGGVKN